MIHVHPSFDDGRGRYPDRIAAAAPRGFRDQVKRDASSPNVGLKMVAEDVGRAIAEREGDEGLRYGVLDPAAFAEDGGPSIAERVNRNLQKAHFRPADNKRVSQRGAMGGWDMMRARLRGDGERPMLYVFDTCTDFIRTVPMLQHDAERPEDLDTAAEDHVADEARYACMSRPWIAAKVTPTAKIRDAWDMTENAEADWRTV